MINKSRLNLASSTDSKLKHGPKNPQHKIYRHNHQLINIALCKRVAERRICIRACELYREAEVAAPTFYLHFRNSDDVLTSYESNLIAGFHKLTPVEAKKFTVYTFLTDYIIKNQNYFLAFNHRRDYHLIVRMIGDYRVNLVGNKISDSSFGLYVGKATTILSCWLTFEALTPESSANCVHDLMAIRVGKVV